MRTLWLLVNETRDVSENMRIEGPGPLLPPWNGDYVFLSLICWFPGDAYYMQTPSMAPKYDKARKYIGLRTHENGAIAVTNSPIQKRLKNDKA